MIAFDLNLVKGTKKDPEQLPASKSFQGSEKWGPCHWNKVCPPAQKVIHILFLWVMSFVVSFRFSHCG